MDGEEEAADEGAGGVINAEEVGGKFDGSEGWLRATAALTQAMIQTSMAFEY